MFDLEPRVTVSDQVGHKPGCTATEELAVGLLTIKFLNFRMSVNFAVIYLKFRKRDQTSAYFVKKMQMK